MNHIVFKRNVKHSRGTTGAVVAGTEFGFNNRDIKIVGSLRGKRQAGDASPDDQ